MNWISALAVKRPLGGLAICLCLAALGVVAAADLKIAFYASRPFPVLTVTTLLPYTGPGEVEIQVTKPIEEEMRGVSGLRRVYSRSRNGRSEVTLELHTTTDVSAA
ncbi:MAG: efflux RND transporter permease subunit, partial [Desulfarculaceae bacterium]